MVDNNHTGMDDLDNFDDFDTVKSVKSFGADATSAFEFDELNDEYLQAERKKKMLLLAALFGLLAAGLLWYWNHMRNSDVDAANVATTQEVAKPEQQVKVLPAESAVGVANPDMANDPTTTPDPTLTKALADIPASDADLEGPLPVDEALANEESERLKDEQSVLAQKTDNLSKQDQQAAEIIALKEQQLAELKAQLASIN